MSGSSSIRRCLAPAALLLTGALLFACSRAPAPPTPEAPIRIGVPAIPATIGHPYQGITIPSVVALQLVFDTLTTLDAQGAFIEGRIVSTIQIRPGGPQLDPANGALGLMRRLTAEAFAQGALAFSEDGRFSVDATAVEGRAP